METFEMKLSNPINHHIVVQTQILNEEEVEILKANVNARRYFYKFTKGQGFATQKIPDSFIDDMQIKCVKRGVNLAKKGKITNGKY